MSVLFDGTAYTSSASVHNHHESFHRFFQNWIAEQDRHLHELLSVSKEETPTSREDEEKVLRPLINQVLEHYEAYYQAKSKWSKQDVLTMLSPTWTSSLEDAFLWIGGWRPSMAFHLLYSKSGLQLEAKFAEVIQGFGSYDLGGLSPTQLSQVDELQGKTITEESKLTDKMAKQQDTVADKSMVELSHLVTELQNIGGNDGDRVDSTLAPKEEGLLRVLEKADDLRMRTIKGVICILKPNQTVHFLIAAAELHLRIHEWGHKKDNAGCRGARPLPD